MYLSKNYVNIAYKKKTLKVPMFGLLTSKLVNYCVKLKKKL